MTQSPLLVAIIGSFRRGNYPQVKNCINKFRSAGIEIVSPSGTDIVAGVEFVRFETDLPELSDAEIQTATLERIFRADAVYVVTGESGYVGRTTCYEIGRIVQRGQPIYFSEQPDDVPVHIPAEHIATAESFVVRFVECREPLRWLYDFGAGDLFDVERRLAGRSPPED